MMDEEDLRNILSWGIVKYPESAVKNSFLNILSNELNLKYGQIKEFIKVFDNRAKLLKYAYNIYTFQNNITSIYDKRGASDDSMEIIDTIEDTEKLTPHDAAEEKNVKSDLQRALMRLPERERVLMVLYYQENMTMKEIGETLNMSESRVCQLHAQGLMKLKNILSENRTTRLQQSIV